MFGFNLGGSRSSTKGHSWIDAATRGLQEGNYNQIQGIPGYQATSADQINGFMSPYIDNVVNKTGEAYGRGLQMIDNQVGDAAQAAHAFGGSRHGVAQGVAQSEALNNYGLLSAQLYNSGYGQALSAAQGDNQFGYSGLLSKYGLQNQALGEITPEQFTKGKTSGFNFGVNASYGGK